MSVGSRNQDKQERPRLLIWGAGKHAHVIADIVRLTSEYSIVGFVDDISPRRNGEIYCGAPVFGGARHLSALYERGVTDGIVAFRDNRARCEKAAILVKSGFKLVTLVHPSAVVAQDLQLGSGSAILAGAILNPGARIGDNVIINTGATVDHHCYLQDGAFIAPGVHLAGGVRIGRRAFVGIGAAIADDITVGDDAVVGAGAVVLKDVAAKTTVIGVPARPIEKLSANASLHGVA